MAQIDDDIRRTVMIVAALDLSYFVIEFVVAWLSPSDAVFANAAGIATTGLALWFASGWPDIVVGLVIGMLNAGAARDVWRAARAERLDAEQAQA